MLSSAGSCVLRRHLAIFSGVLAFGLLYATRWRRRGLRPAGYVQYLLLVAPMAVDGLTQLGGWRESPGSCGWLQACCSGSAVPGALPALCAMVPSDCPDAASS